MDVTVDYVINKFILNDYSNQSTSFQYITDEIFINKLKNKKKVIYSDNLENYKVENCYPNYIFSKDTTSVYVKNSITGDFSNLDDIKINLDRKNVTTRVFSRSNKITDLTEVKKIYDNSLWKPSLRNYSGIQKKIVESILIRENALNLTTLKNLESNISFDKNLIESVNDPYNQEWENFSETSHELITGKPFFGEYNPVILLINYNNTLPKSIFSTSYYYRDLYFTPPRTGIYKIRTQQEGLSDTYTNQSWNRGYIRIYKDIVNLPTSYITAAPTSGYGDTRHIFLTKGVQCKLHSTCATSYQTSKNIIEITYKGPERDDINLSELVISFEDPSGNMVEEYNYNNINYSTDPLKLKITAAILNIKTQLVMFSTKGVIFEEHEKYAINRFCFGNFKFVNYKQGNLYKIIKKSIEIKE